MTTYTMRLPERWGQGVTIIAGYTGRMWGLVCRWNKLTDNFNDPPHAVFVSPAQPRLHSLSGNLADAPDSRCAHQHSLRGDSISIP